MRAVQITAPAARRSSPPSSCPTRGPGRASCSSTSPSAGVNYIDTYNRSGAYPVDLPFVLGQEGAGRVAALGPGDTGGFAVGDRVAWANVFGGYAERVAVAGRRRRRRAGRGPRRRRRRRLPAGHDRALPRHRLRPGRCRRHRARPRRGRRGRAAAHPARHRARGPGARRPSPPTEKAELARAAGAAEVLALRPRRRPGRRGPRPDRRRGRGGRVRRRRARHLRRQPGERAPARHPGALRRRQRTGAAGGPAAAQPGRVGVPDPPEAARLHRHPRGAAPPARPRCSPRSRTAPATCGSGTATRWPRPRRRTEDLEGRRTTGQGAAAPVGGGMR